MVPTVTLSELLDRFGLDRVDLLKINTEGAELSVLRGLRPEHWPRIRQVCLEVERSSVTTPQVRELLCAAGFEVHEIGGWNVGADADVSYLYAVRSEDRPPAGSPWDEPADQMLTTGQLRDTWRRRCRPRCARTSSSSSTTCPGSPTARWPGWSCRRHRPGPAGLPRSRAAC